MDKKFLDEKLTYIQEWEYLNKWLLLIVISSFIPYIIAKIAGKSEHKKLLDIHRRDIEVETRTALNDTVEKLFKIGNTLRNDLLKIPQVKDSFINSGSLESLNDRTIFQKKMFIYFEQLMKNFRKNKDDKKIFDKPLYTNIIGNKWKVESKDVNQKNNISKAESMIQKADDSAYVILKDFKTKITNVVIKYVGEND